MSNRSAPPILTRGWFITFEGPDGGGKTTQVGLLESRLRRTGVPVQATREPGGTDIGQELRRMLLQPDRPALCDETEALLLCADRAQHARQVIRPALERRKLVISDRYSDSTLAYQGYGDGLDLDTLRLITRFATSDLVPDLTILLDIDVETGLERKRAALFAGEGEYNRIDDRQVDYHRRVRAGFRQLVDEEPGRFFVLNGESPPHMLAERIWEKVVSTLGLPGERFEAGRDERVT